MKKGVFGVILLKGFRLQIAPGRVTLLARQAIAEGQEDAMSVTNITKTGLTYNSSANHDPDGDSNGTSILVKRS